MNTTSSNGTSPNGTTTTIDIGPDGTEVPRPRTAESETDRPQTSLVSVDPTTAKRWLARNGANRRVRARQVAKFAADMTEGRWALTGAPVQFATDGRLLDGQHRLHAIVQSGATVDLFVVRGLDPRAQAFMDVGAKRTLADQLLLGGHRNHTILAAGARLAFAWLSGRLHEPRAALSEAEIREFIDDNPTLTVAAELAAKLRSAGLDVHQSSLCAAIWILLEEHHTQGDVREFFTSIAENRTNGVGDPRNALLQRIASSRRQHERIDSAVVLGLLIRTYNAHYRGTSLRKLQVHRDGEPIDIPAVVKPRPGAAPRTGGDG